MKLDTLKNEFKYDGYSIEERYFYELNLKLQNELKLKMETQKNFREFSIERCETDSVLVKNCPKSNDLINPLSAQNKEDQ